MYDIFPFPSITGATAEEKIGQLCNYLIQLKEELEFQLTSISVENLDHELIQKLNDMGANIEKNNQDREDQMQQVATKSITVSDVINSAMFEAEVQSIKDEVLNDIQSSVSFTVNFTTGNLEYKTS